MATLVRLIMGALIGLFSVFTYCSSTAENPVTGEKQRIGISYEEEALLGAHAAPQMMEQFGGLAADSPANSVIDQIGARLVDQVDEKLPYQYEFHLLADAGTVNAFALPGGQVFITEGLLSKLTSEGQLACVLAHEVAHVVARHGAEHVAKAQLTQGLTGAAILATYDPSSPSAAQRAQMTQLAGKLIGMKFGRQDELEADTLGVKFAAEAGYDPRSFIAVMDVLEKSSKRGNTPEIFSTHPSAGNRREKITKAIEQLYPDGLPEGLTP